MTFYGFIIGTEIAGIILLLFWIFKPYPFFVEIEALKKEVEK